MTTSMITKKEDKKENKKADADFCLNLLKMLINHHDPINLISQGIKERWINLHISKRILTDPHKKKLSTKVSDMIVTPEIMAESVLLKTILSLMFEAMRKIRDGLNGNGEYIKVIQLYDNYGEYRFPMMMFTIRMMQEDGSYCKLGPFRWRIEYFAILDLYGPYMLLMFDDEHI